MSDDDLMLPGTLKFGAEFFIGNLQIDMLFGQDRILFAKEGPASICDDRLRTDDSISLSNFIRGSYPHVISETAFFHSNIIDKAGLFDIYIYGADYE